MNNYNKWIKKVKKIFNTISGNVELPEDIKYTAEKKILHISDTPDCIYPFIFRLIDNLQPDIIIHTGDVVDNVKLGNGSSLTSYVGSLQEIINNFELKKDKQIYIVPGNHDSINILKRMSENIKLQEEGSKITIEGVTIGLAHYPEHLPAEARINLFGHCKKEYSEEGKIFLNGLLNINVILLPSQKIYKIDYPLKTDNERKYRNCYFR